MSQGAVVLYCAPVEHQVQLLLEDFWLILERGRDGDWEGESKGGREGGKDGGMDGGREGETDGDREEES